MLTSTIGYVSMAQSGAPGSGFKSDPDADIIIALAAGDEGALKMLMARHLPSIKSLARHMLRDDMQAEDIAQEVFIKAWKQAPNWQSGTAKFSTWLHRVAKNLCYDRLRKKTETNVDVLPDIADTSSSVDVNMIIQEGDLSRKSHIITALQALPKRQAMAITLCHFQDKSQKQAADIMDINRRAYESLLARGRKNLRQHLKPHKKALLKDMGEPS